MSPPYGPPLHEHAGAVPVAPLPYTASPRSARTRIVAPRRQRLEIWHRIVDRIDTFDLPSATHREKNRGHGVANTLALNGLPCKPTARCILPVTRVDGVRLNHRLRCGWSTFVCRTTPSASSVGGAASPVERLWARKQSPLPAVQLGQEQDIEYLMKSIELSLQRLHPPTIRHLVARPRMATCSQNGPCTCCRNGWKRNAEILLSSISASSTGHSLQRRLHTMSA